MAALHWHEGQEDSGMLIHWWQSKPGHVSLALDPAGGNQCIVTVIISMRTSALVPVQNLGLVCSSRQCCLMDLWHTQSPWGCGFQKGCTAYVAFSLHFRDRS